MKIKSAEFLVSNQDVAKCPQNKIPEYAFIGRSNVGKSSLINMLTSRKSLAKTSGKPGKTQLINHFIINNAWYLVDLPGYGYAKVSKSSKRIFQKFITEYFEQRKQLIAAFVLIDIRHKPQIIDLNFMEWLGSNQIPFAIIFTKVDKLKPKNVDEYLTSYKDILLETWEELPQYFVTSSSKSIGKKDLLSYIDSINYDITKTSKSN
ncbi:ribosome biogenesis GTP-binding protein YihA/YsxC [Flavobacteriaceae bacterium]|jgi:GTP-binding protein|nr:YihA family ribosome biogenesis GTP-binding protein [Flavobacteriaceae bacterium]MDB2612385.1 ribosome biogenesis GTP-binding protein YihA/YsxC [Flavobacteriaceae bacterium]MDC0957092.1 ribosome biogenesis GTP-binding protein YihA/YsxC [Flavobacteriaceae bacterium]MDC1051946.1 ribosome biogenesis GTP-binding protein YihA/YsxC [Flavobacteriaceae bacterium]MDC3312815.1 ribosome biogenesis GTP-binding protein YihA/YsxC [Flavobacteriaceae bacterium]|tara:strand:- start:1740 stop:2357 length:618 start_codon:yes stop_codon:yes gene_type:complete